LGPHRIFRNDGTAETPLWILVTKGFQDIDIASIGKSSPFFVDIDGDSDLDLYVGDGDGYLSFWRNSTGENITSVDEYTDITSRLPNLFLLYPNYPNPFNPSTTITYQLQKGVKVRLFIYNMLGQLVKTLVNSKQVTGYYSVQWNGKDELGRDVASGVYFYHLETDHFSKTLKMALLR